MPAYHHVNYAANLGSQINNNTAVANTQQMHMDNFSLARVQHTKVKFETAQREKQTT